MKHFLIIALSLFLVTSLSACQTFEGIKEDIAAIDLSNFGTASSINAQDQQSNSLIDGDCPKIEIVDELSMLNAFTDERRPSEDSRLSTVTLSDALSTCSYGERSVTVDLKLDLHGQIGPQGRANTSDQPFFTHPYFVAVTSQSGKILAKELFDASMTYKAGESQHSYTESLRQIIPADSRAEGSKLKIVVGFQLTQNQLAYNRAIIERREATRIEFEKQQESLTKSISKKTTASIEKPPIPKIKTPQITAPKITAPKIAAPNIPVPKITAPQIAAPETVTPTISAPDIYIPNIPAGAEEQTKTFNRAGPIDITVP